MTSEAADSAASLARPPRGGEPHRGDAVRLFEARRLARPAALAHAEILGVPVARTSRSDARRRIAALAGGTGHHTLFFVNAHALNLAARDAAFRTALVSADLVLNDGVGVALAGRIAGTPFPANLNGTDLLPHVLADLAAQKRRVFFYGAQPGVAERCAEHWRRAVRGLQVAGSLDGYTVSPGVAAEYIRLRRPDVVLVALGNPRQELWAARFAARTGAQLVVGVGAFFDFTVGDVRRAPRWLRALRLEWAYRLVQEPRRLAGRYLVGVPLFLARVAAT